MAKKEEGMDLRGLLVLKLQTLLDVETELAKALPKMAEAATDADLTLGFEEHAQQTEEHVQRIEKALDLLKVEPDKEESAAVRGLIEDAEWIIKHVKGDAAKDAALTAAARTAEHFEIAKYLSSVAWAHILDETAVADLLQKTLEEEQETEDKLASLADTKLDDLASDPGTHKKGDKNKEDDEWDPEEDEDDDDDEEEKAEE